MDLVCEGWRPSGGWIPGAGSREIIQLSEMLKELSAYPPERQDVTRYQEPRWSIPQADEPTSPLRPMARTERMPRGSKVDAAVGGTMWTI